MPKASSWALTAENGLDCDMFKHRSSKNGDLPYVIIYGKREFRITDCSEIENADKACSVPHKHVLVQLKVKGSEASTSATNNTVYKVLKDELLARDADQGTLKARYNQPVVSMRSYKLYLHKECCERGLPVDDDHKTEAQLRKEAHARDQERRIMEAVKSNPNATPLEIGLVLQKKVGLKAAHALMPLIKTALSIYNEGSSRHVMFTSSSEWADLVLSTIARAKVRVPGVHDKAESKVIALFLVALANCIRRDVGGDDSMPALFVYGPAGSGKTSLFKGARKFVIAADAGGVGRYESNAPLFIFDDVTVQFIQDERNLSTIRALCTNDPTSTKTHGSTQRLSGKWLAITSNDKRPKSSPERRRFCFIKTAKLDISPVQHSPKQSHACRALSRKVLDVLLSDEYSPSDWWCNIVRLRYLTDLCEIHNVVVPKGHRFNELFFKVFKEDGSSSSGEESSSSSCSELGVRGSVGRGGRNAKRARRLSSSSNGDTEVDC